MKMKKVVCFGALVLSACGGASASTTTESTAASQASTDIARADFLNMMVEILPAAICNNDEHPLRVCIESSAEECASNLGALARECITEIAPNIPETVPDTEAAGEQYGAMLGECVGGRYVAQAAAAGKFRSSDPNCQPSE